VHLDLNPENILVNNERELSLNADDPTEESGF
jgi:hypothetical protein